MEGIYLDGGRRTTQLMRDSLGSGIGHREWTSLNRNRVHSIFPNRPGRSRLSYGNPHAFRDHQSLRSLLSLGVELTEPLPNKRLKLAARVD